MEYNIFRMFFLGKALCLCSWSIHHNAHAQYLTQRTDAADYMHVVVGGNGGK